jgi:hypothetical protein
VDLVSSGKIKIIKHSLQPKGWSYFFRNINLNKPVFLNSNMPFQDTYNQITESEVFKKFIQENPEAELCAGFFILDFISNDSKNSLDYKSWDKIFTFDLKDDGFVKLTEDKLIDSPNSPQLLNLIPKVTTEVEELKGLAGIEALDRGISAKFNKIIAVLQRQSKDNKEIQLWNLTCMLDGLIILNIQINADTGEIIKFERKSMMDLIRKK